jgi:hypothetical protein
VLLAGEQCPKCGGPATIAPFITADGTPASEVVLHHGCPDPECESPDDPPTIELIEIETLAAGGEPITYRAETHPDCWARFQQARATETSPPAHVWQLDEEPAGTDGE